MKSVRTLATSAGRTNGYGSSITRVYPATDADT